MGWFKYVNCITRREIRLFSPWSDSKWCLDHLPWSVLTWTLDACFTSLGKKKRAVLLRAGTGYSPVLHQALKWCLTRTNKKNDGLDVHTWETAGEVCGEAELNFFIIRYYTFTISSLGVIIPYLFLSKELNHPLESNRKIMFSHH